MDRHRPAPGEYAPYYETYIAAAGAGDPLQLLEVQADEIRGVLAGLSEEQGAFRYGIDKWSIRGLVGHLSDSERVFAYRALRFGRGDEAPLAGFDQEEWAAATNADARSLADVSTELLAVRASTVALFRGLPAEAFSRGGVASDNYVTVRALLYIVIGHAAHHFTILRERYLANPEFPR